MFKDQVFVVFTGMSLFAACILSTLTYRDFKDLSIERKSKKEEAL
jgi:hypothetical protein